MIEQKHILVNSSTGVISQKPSTRDFTDAVLPPHQEVFYSGDLSISTISVFRRELSYTILDAASTITVDTLLRDAQTQLRESITRGITPLLKEDNNSSSVVLWTYCIHQLTLRDRDLSTKTDRARENRERRGCAVAAWWAGELYTLAQPDILELVESKLAALAAPFPLPRYPEDVTRVPGLLTKALCSFAISRIAFEARDLKLLSEILLSSTPECQTIGAASYCSLCHVPSLRQESSWPRLRAEALEIGERALPHVKGIAAMYLNSGMSKLSQ